MPNISPPKSPTQRHSDVFIVPIAVYAESLCVRNEGSISHKQLSETLIELLSGQGLSRNFERLKGQGSVYSHRVNDKIRLLCVQVPWQGGKAWVVVEIMEDHAYETSPFLNLSGKARAARIQKYLANYRSYRWDPENTKLLEESVDTLPEATPLVQQAGRYIRLTAQQNSALSTLTETTGDVRIVAGQPGSGKSTLLMESLSALATILATDESETTQILCTVPSLPLKQALSQEWLSQPDAMKMERDPVKMFTEEDLLKFLITPLSIYTATSHDAFIRWAKTNEIQASEFEAVDLMQLYQELCALNALRVKALYQPEKTVLDLYAMEALQSAFLCLPRSKKTPAEQQRRQFGAILLNLLAQYEVHLRTQQDFDPRLFCPQQPITPDGKFYIFTDETQNIAPSILFMLLTFSRLKTTFFMNDSQGMAFRARLNEILILNDRSLVGDALKNIIRLSGSHRCPKKVIEATLSIEALKHRIHPDGKHAVTSDQLQACNPKDGERFWGSMSDFHKLEKVLRSGNAVMLILGQGLSSEEIRNLTTTYPKTPLFLKDNFPEGLEYGDVILIDPFGDEDHKLSRSFASPGKSELNSNEIDYYRQRLSRCVAAFTRATNRLIILQKAEQPLVSLFTQLTENCTFIPLEGLNALHAEALSEDELFDRACELYRLGQQQVARNLIQTLDLETQNRFHQEMMPPKAELPKNLEPKVAHQSTTAKMPLPLESVVLQQMSSPSQTTPKSSVTLPSEASMQKQLEMYLRDNQKLSHLFKYTKEVKDLNHLFMTPMTGIGRRESFLEAAATLIHIEIPKRGSLKMGTIGERIFQIRDMFHPILNQLDLELDYTSISLQQSHLKVLSLISPSAFSINTHGIDVIPSKCPAAELIDKGLSMSPNPISLAEYDLTEIGGLHHYLRRRLNFVDDLVQAYLYAHQHGYGYFTVDEVILMGRILSEQKLVDDIFPSAATLFGEKSWIFIDRMRAMKDGNKNLFQTLLQVAVDKNPKSTVALILIFDGQYFIRYR